MKPFWLALAATASLQAAPLEVESGAYSSGKAYVACDFDGAKTRCFIDTGSAMTLVTNSKLFNTYTNLGTLYFKSATGIPQQTETICVNTIQFDETAFASARVGRVDFRGAEPTLGIDFLGRQPFALMFRSKKLLRLNAECPEFPALTLNVSPQGLLSIPISLGGKAIRALWDTGSALTTVDENFIHAHPETFKPTKNYVNGVDGAGKSLLLQIYRAKKIGIEEQTFENVRVIAADLSVLRAGLNDKDAQAIVGFNLIRKGNWFFDPKNRLWKCER